MQITDDDLKGFIEIHKKEFGEELSKAEASEIASNLVDLYMLLSEPLPSELEEMKKTKHPSGAGETPPASAS